MPTLLPIIHMMLPSGSPSYPRYDFERFNFWNDIFQCDIVNDGRFKKWYWEALGGDSWPYPLHSAELIDAYIYEHYADELKKPEMMARILGHKD